MVAVSMYWLRTWEHKSTTWCLIIRLSGRQVLASMCSPSILNIIPSYSQTPFWKQNRSMISYRMYQRQTASTRYIYVGCEESRSWRKEINLSSIALLIIKDQPPIVAYVHQSAPSARWKPSKTLPMKMLLYDTPTAIQFSTKENWEAGIAQRTTSL